MATAVIQPTLGKKMASPRQVESHPEIYEKSYASA